MKLGYVITFKDTIIGVAMTRGAARREAKAAAFVLADGNAETFEAQWEEHRCTPAFRELHRKELFPPDGEAITIGCVSIFGLRGELGALHDRQALETALAGRGAAVPARNRRL